MNLYGAHCSVDILDQLVMRKRRLFVKFYRGVMGTGRLTRPIPNIIGFLLSDQDLENQSWSASDWEIEPRQLPIHPRPDLANPPLCPQVVTLVGVPKMARAGTSVSAFIILAAAGGRSSYQAHVADVAFAYSHAHAQAHCDADADHLLQSAQS